MTLERISHSVQNVTVLIKTTGITNNEISVLNMIKNVRMKLINLTTIICQTNRYFSKGFKDGF